MAAIVPRSWTNGPYFKRFREHMLAHVSLDRIQAFASRSALFSEAKVLQENVIVTCTRSREQGEVELIFDDAEPRRVPFRSIVHPRDANANFPGPLSGRSDSGSRPARSSTSVLVNILPNPATTPTR